MMESEELMESLKERIKEILPIIDTAAGHATSFEKLPEILLDIKMALMPIQRFAYTLSDQEMNAMHNAMNNLYTILPSYIQDASHYKQNTGQKLQEVATAALSKIETLSNEVANRDDGNMPVVLQERFSKIDYSEFMDTLNLQQEEINTLKAKINIVQEEKDALEKYINLEGREQRLTDLGNYADSIIIETNRALVEANKALEATEKEFGIRAAHELEVEYKNAFTNYSKLSIQWLIASVIFGVVLLMTIIFYSATPDNYGTADKNEIINEQKSKTELTISKDGVSNIIKQSDGIKTHENKHELADTLHDISPYATKFSIIALLLGLGTFCIKISLSYRRLAEEYNHKTILAKNLLMGGKALEGFLGDRDKMVEAFAVPSLLQILEDPLVKSRKDKGGNDVTLVEKITNKLFDSAEKKKD